MQDSILKTYIRGNMLMKPSRGCSGGSAAGNNYMSRRASESTMCPVSAALDLNDSVCEPESGNSCDEGDDFQPLHLTTVYSCDYDPEFQEGHQYETAAAAVPVITGSTKKEFYCEVEEQQMMEMDKFFKTLPPAPRLRPKVFDEGLLDDEFHMPFQL